MAKRFLPVVCLVIASLLFSGCGPEEVEIPVTGDVQVQEQAGFSSPAAATAQPHLGEEIYLEQCAVCHGENGKGEGTFPALAGSREVLEAEPTGLIGFLLHGRDNIHAYGGDMDNEEISSMLTFIPGAWTNQAGAVTPDEVQSLR